MNRILDKHAPSKRLSKYKLKFKTKPWIAMALQLVITLIKKKFILNIKFAETCYLQKKKKVNKTI